MYIAIAANLTQVTINQPLRELKSQIYTEQSGRSKNIYLTGMAKVKFKNSYFLVF